MTRSRFYTGRPWDIPEDPTDPEVEVTMTLEDYIAAESGHIPTPPEVKEHDPTTE